MFFTSKYRHLMVMLHEAFDVLYLSNRLQRRAVEHLPCGKIQPCNSLFRLSPITFSILIIQTFLEISSQNICYPRIKCDLVTPYGDRCWWIFIKIVSSFLTAPSQCLNQLWQWNHNEQTSVYETTWWSHQMEAFSACPLCWEFTGDR